MTQLVVGTPTLEGTRRFVRYAFMPNRLQYCGGDDSNAIMEHAITGEGRSAATPALKKFTGALPYLTLIAHETGIADPFDARVVEAYWLGNELLDRVEAAGLYGNLRERFAKNLSPRMLELVAGKAPRGARPHHNFHVFDVHCRAGELDRTLATMDQCRISWARVVTAEAGSLIVERQPLAVIDGILCLGPVQQEHVVRELGGHGFADDAAPGDCVSIHWGWVCEVIDERCRGNLERYTLHHLRLANETL